MYLRNDLATSLPYQFLFVFAITLWECIVIAINSPKLFTMKSSVFAIILAILSAFYGLCLLLIPVKFASMYDATLTASGIYLARVYGVTLASFGILFWLNRNIPFSDRSWQSLLLATLVSQAIDAVIAVRELMNNQGNSLGWTTVAVNVLVCLGSLYFLVQKKTVKATGLA